MASGHTDSEDDEPPDDLICPITYSLFRDPVLCRSDGRVYERSGIVGFWRRRPLADFLGGARLQSVPHWPALERAVRDAPHNPSGHGPCDTYFDASLKRFVESGHDATIYKAFGYAGCCNHSGYFVKR